jgi:nicotinate-nucleotide pyrophosphorylase (carboxylating)
MLSEGLTPAIIEHDLDPQSIEDLVRRTIAEDLDGGVDMTSDATIPATQKSFAEFRTRKSGYVAGVVVAAAVLEVCGISEYEILAADGKRVEEGQVIIAVTGNTQKLLLAERTIASNT